MPRLEDVFAPLDRETHATVEGVQDVLPTPNGSVFIIRPDDKDFKLSNIHRTKLRDVDLVEDTDGANVYRVSEEGNATLSVEKDGLDYVLKTI